MRSELPPGLPPFPDPGDVAERRESMQRLFAETLELRLQAQEQRARCRAAMERFSATVREARQRLMSDLRDEPPAPGPAGDPPDHVT